MTMTATKALSDEQIQQFKTRGYTIAEGFFDQRQVAAMQAEVQRFRDEGLVHNVRTEGDGQTQSTEKANLQLCPMSPHSTLFRALPFTEKVTQAVSSLIGDEIRLHLDQMFLKPAKHGSGTNWHQDNAYFHIADPLQGTAMWVAVHDANLTNGTLRVIPESFHQRFEHSRDPQSDHHIRCYPDDSNAQPLELKAGSVVFFCYGTAHATGANNSDGDRAGAAFHFLTSEADRTSANQQSASSASAKPYLTGPHADGGMQAYGQDMRGLWPA